MRLNAATVRECKTVKQAAGCQRLDPHPSSIVAALCASGNAEVDFLGPIARAYVAFDVSPVERSPTGSGRFLAHSKKCELEVDCPA